MNYEKKYKEVVGKIRKAYLYAQTDSTKTVLEDIIPELAESEEEKIRKRLITDFGTIGKKEWGGLEVKDILAWLEKQREKKPEENKGNIGEISPNWSEEDSFRTETLISVIKSGGSIRPELRNEFINWLKSFRPQSQWKPSDRQMDSITCAVKKMKESACYDSELVSLFNDLKKLKKE